MAQARDAARERRRTTLASIAAAAVLMGLKLGVGLATGSLALVSAGIESSGDVVAAVLTFFAVRLAGRPADRGHPYGHLRAENLGALGEAAILLAGGIVVAVEAVTRLLEGAGPPGIHWYQFAVLAVALAVDLARTSASLSAARRHRSPALRSNALHFGSDMAGTVAVLAGLIAVHAGLRQGDSLAALLVSAIIVAAALRLSTVNANVLMDRTPASARRAAERAIEEIGQDIELRRLRLRESAGRYFADVVVSVPAGRAVVEGHDAADRVEQAVQAALPDSDVVVHVEPRARGLDLRDRVYAIALSEPLVKEVHDISVFEHDGRSSVSLHLKFPADLDLSSAHVVAERVERAICARPGVIEAQTHLEPIEMPIGAHPPPDQGVGELAAVREVRRIVRGRAGVEPRRVRLLDTEVGRVVFLTLPVSGQESLTAAHLLAGELEEELRRCMAGIADVIVHTEP